MALFEGDQDRVNTLAQVHNTSEFIVWGARGRGSRDVFNADAPRPAVQVIRRSQRVVGVVSCAVFDGVHEVQGHAAAEQRQGIHIEHSLTLPRRDPPKTRFAG